MAWLSNALGGIGMEFFIQVSKPICLNNYDNADESLADAMETIFPLLTEGAIIMWNYIPIRLSYKYDISYMLDDIVDMLLMIRTKEKGKMEIQWLPDTFRCDWKLQWNEGTIKIKSEWGGIIGDLEKILNKNSEVCLKVNEFRGEWKKLLELVIKNLKNSGYQENQIRNMDNLLVEYNKISEEGILYQEKKIKL
jgi:hypothetical protein